MFIMCKKFKILNRHIGFPMGNVMSFSNYHPSKKNHLVSDIQWFGWAPDWIVQNLQAAKRIYICFTRYGKQKILHWWWVGRGLQIFREWSDAKQKGKGDETIDRTPFLILSNYDNLFPMEQEIWNTRILLKHVKEVPWLKDAATGLLHPYAWKLFFQEHGVVSQ